MFRATLLLLAASALALPAPVPSPSPSLSLTVNVLAEQEVLRPDPTTTTTRRKKKTSTAPSESATDTSPTSPSPVPSEVFTSPVPSEASPASAAPPGPTFTPNPNPFIDPATPTNGTSSSSNFTATVQPQSIVSTSGTPGLVVVTEVLTVTANPNGQDNGAKVYFPSALNYWVMHALSVIEWAPALPVPVDIRLTSPDTDLLVYDYLLSSNVPAGFSSLALSVMEPAHPAKGYQLLVADHENGTIYSTSEMFEIKKAGTSVLVPAGYAAATQSGGIIAQASGASMMWSTATATAIVALALGALWL
ncbi:hypothetical protein CcaverHIS002_0407490 [Cutaneotrichosporon cavernicola]|uniref:Uncharacterized protein n=1 Tax=Cutaneotrichosporon cavernicola TaxID=279322 RepID=A0AA48L4S9_9TREE|nr:uncharacterized protein CcaverHIS019_0407480 [Cutaneotrichosporon cavernicola]BEI84145.1 hypothetical protein CcaverHIS002_0407490 [Cutaneotrichosporon cavernicola]BEI91928.1 hypothetical protein CcaverHIS019_0407480 [Cutaneotrichosporon cavernicola]BEI99699.1 hypothetical protein CcaverHIS631_0407420 [Cutaneotrichosporon cavernicola]BEJ07474.1 hypothetical protein CcaverHIS641_0407430 [Cutaneotrichosporon cavernicola]